MTQITGAALGVEAGRRLAARRRDIQPGLTPAEFDRIEQQYGFEFADDHRAFLSVGHPVLSMHQTDSIFYGVNLLDYVYQAFSAGPGLPLGARMAAADDRPVLARVP